MSGVSFGLLEGRNPALTLPLRAGLQVIAPPTTAQHQMAVVAHLDVRRCQAEGATTGVCHVSLSPAG